MNLKKEVLIVFNPYIPKGKPRPFRYRCISVNKLSEYIPAERAEKELQKFMESGLEKDNFYAAKCGKVYLYRK